MNAKRMSLALLLILWALPLPAADDGYYIGAWGGGVLLDEAKGRGSEGTLNADFEPGYGAGISFGYDLGRQYPEVGQGRLEIEVAQRRNDLDDIEFSDGTAAASGDVTALTVMFNSFADFYQYRPWLPYVGLGLGYAQVSLNDAQVTGGALGDDSDGVFAYMAAVGVGYQVTSMVTLDLGYRFLGALDPKFKLADGTTVDWDYDSHSATLGLRVKF